MKKRPILFLSNRRHGEKETSRFSINGGTSQVLIPSEAPWILNPTSKASQASGKNMKIDIDKFETGWLDVFVGLTSKDIDALIANLQRLKHDSNYHFHIQNRFESNDPNVSNLTFSLDALNSPENAEMYPEP